MQKVANQESLFGDLPSASTPFKVKDAPQATMQERLGWEKELLGLYVSGHPLERVRDKIEKSGMSIKKIKEEVGKGMPVKFAGIIESIKTVMTKNNEAMIFGRITDFDGSIEFVVFPKSLKELAITLAEDMIIAVSGKVSERNGEKSILVDAVKQL